MNVSPIKNNSSFFTNRKKFIKAHKQQTSIKGKKLDKDRFFDVVAIDLVEEDGDFVKQTSKKIKKFFENKIFNTEGNSNLFSSEVLYDNSLEAFREAQKFYESQDKVLKNNIEQANSSQKDLLKDMTDLQNDVCLSDNQKRRISDVSDSISAYMSQDRSPLENIKHSEKARGFIFIQQKIKSIFKKYYFRFGAFFEKKFPHSYDASSKKTCKKIKELANKVGCCFAHCLKLNLVKDSDIV